MPPKGSKVSKRSAAAAAASTTDNKSRKARGGAAHTNTAGETSQTAAESGKSEAVNNNDSTTTLHTTNKDNNAITNAAAATTTTSTSNTIASDNAMNNSNHKDSNESYDTIDELLGISQSSRVTKTNKSAIHTDKSNNNHINHNSNHNRDNDTLLSAPADPKHISYFSVAGLSRVGDSQRTALLYAAHKEIRSLKQFPACVYNCSSNINRQRSGDSDNKNSNNKKNNNNDKNDNNNIGERTSGSVKKQKHVTTSSMNGAGGRTHTESIEMIGAAATADSSDEDFSDSDGDNDGGAIFSLTDERLFSPPYVRLLLSFTSYSQVKSQRKRSSSSNSNNNNHSQGATSIATSGSSSSGAFSAAHENTKNNNNNNVASNKDGNSYNSVMLLKAAEAQMDALVGCILSDIIRLYSEHERHGVNDEDGTIDRGTFPFQLFPGALINNDNNNNSKGNSKFSRRHAKRFCVFATPSDVEKALYVLSSPFMFLVASHSNSNNSNNNNNNNKSLNAVGSFSTHSKSSPALGAGSFSSHSMSLAPGVPSSSSFNFSSLSALIERLNESKALPTLLQSHLYSQILQVPGADGYGTNSGGKKRTGNNNSNNSDDSDRDDETTQQEQKRTQQLEEMRVNIQDRYLTAFFASLPLMNTTTTAQTSGSTTNSNNTQHNKRDVLEERFVFGSAANSTRASFSGIYNTSNNNNNNNNNNNRGVVSALTVSEFSTVLSDIISATGYISEEQLSCLLSELVAHSPVLHGRLASSSSSYSLPSSSSFAAVAAATAAAAPALGAYGNTHNQRSGDANGIHDTGMSSVLSGGGNLFSGPEGGARAPSAAAAARVLLARQDSLRGAILHQISESIHEGIAEVSLGEVGGSAAYSSTSFHHHHLHHHNKSSNEKEGGVYHDNGNNSDDNEGDGDGAGDRPFRVADRILESAQEEKRRGLRLVSRGVSVAVALCELSPLSFGLPVVSTLYAFWNPTAAAATATTGGSAFSSTLPVSASAVESGFGIIMNDAHGSNFRHSRSAATARTAAASATTVSYSVRTVLLRAFSSLFKCREDMIDACPQYFAAIAADCAALDSNNNNSNSHNGSNHPSRSRQQGSSSTNTGVSAAEAAERTALSMESITLLTESILLNTLHSNNNNSNSKSDNFPSNSASLSSFSAFFNDTVEHAPGNGKSGKKKGIGSGDGGNNNNNSYNRSSNPNYANIYGVPDGNNSDSNTNNKNDNSGSGGDHLLHHKNHVDANKRNTNFSPAAILKYWTQYIHPFLSLKLTCQHVPTRRQAVRSFAKILLLLPTETAALLLPPLPPPTLPSVFSSSSSSSLSSLPLPSSLHAAVSKTAATAAAPAAAEGFAGGSSTGETSLSVESTLGLRAADKNGKLREHAVGFLALIYRHFTTFNYNHNNHNHHNHNHNNSSIAYPAAVVADVSWIPAVIMNSVSVSTNHHNATNADAALRVVEKALELMLPITAENTLASQKDDYAAFYSNNTSTSGSRAIPPVSASTGDGGGGGLVQLMQHLHSYSERHELQRQQQQRHRHFSLSTDADHAETTFQNNNNIDSTDDNITKARNDETKNNNNNVRSGRNETGKSREASKSTARDPRTEAKRQLMSAVHREELRGACDDGGAISAYTHTLFTLAAKKRQSRRAVLRLYQMRQAIQHLPNPKESAEGQQLISGIQRLLLFLQESTPSLPVSSSSSSSGSATAAAATAAAVGASVPGGGNNSGNAAARKAWDALFRCRDERVSAALMRFCSLDDAEAEKKEREGENEEDDRNGNIDNGGGGKHTVDWQAERARLLSAVAGRLPADTIQYVKEELLSLLSFPFSASHVESITCFIRTQLTAYKEFVSDTRASKGAGDAGSVGVVSFDVYARRKAVDRQLLCGLQALSFAVAAAPCFLTHDTRVLSVLLDAADVVVNIPTASLVRVSEDLFRDIPSAQVRSGDDHSSNRKALNAPSSSSASAVFAEFGVDTATIATTQHHHSNNNNNNNNITKSKRKRKTEDDDEEEEEAESGAVTSAVLTRPPAWIFLLFHLLGEWATAEELYSTTVQNNANKNSNGRGGGGSDSEKHRFAGVEQALGGNRKHAVLMMLGQICSGSLPVATVPHGLEHNAAAFLHVLSHKASPAPTHKCDNRDNKSSNNDNRVVAVVDYRHYGRLSKSAAQCMVNVLGNTHFATHGKALTALLHTLSSIVSKATTTTATTAAAAAAGEGGENEEEEGGNTASRARAGKGYRGKKQAAGEATNNTTTTSTTASSVTTVGPSFALRLSVVCATLRMFSRLSASASLLASGSAASHLIDDCLTLLEIHTANNANSNINNAGRRRREKADPERMRWKDYAALVTFLQSDSSLLSLSNTHSSSAATNTTAAPVDKSSGGGGNTKQTRFDYFSISPSAAAADAAVKLCGTLCFNCFASVQFQTVASDIMGKLLKSFKAIHGDQNSKDGNHTDNGEASGNNNNSAGSIGSCQRRCSVFKQMVKLLRLPGRELSREMVAAVLLSTEEAAPVRELIQGRLALHILMTASSSFSPSSSSSVISLSSSGGGGTAGTRGSFASSSYSPALSLPPPSPSAILRKSASFLSTIVPERTNTRGATDTPPQPPPLVKMSVGAINTTFGVRVGRADVRFVSFLLLTAVAEESRAGYAQLRRLVSLVGDAMRANLQRHNAAAAAAAAAANSNNNSSTTTTAGANRGFISLSSPNAFYYYVEYCLPFLVFFLSHHSFYAFERDENNFMSFQRVLFLFFEECFRLSTQSAPFLTELLARIKQSNDVLSPPPPLATHAPGGRKSRVAHTNSNNNNNKSDYNKVLCDLASRVMQAVLSQKSQLSSDAQRRYPGAVLLPSFFVSVTGPDGNSSSSSSEKGRRHSGADDDAYGDDNHDAERHKAAEKEREKLRLQILTTVYLDAKVHVGSGAPFRAPLLSHAGADVNGESDAAADNPNNNNNNNNRDATSSRSARQSARRSGRKRRRPAVDSISGSSGSSAEDESEGSEEFVTSESGESSGDDDEEESSGAVVKTSRNSTFKRDATRKNADENEEEEEEEEEEVWIGDGASSSTNRTNNNNKNSDNNNNNKSNAKRAQTPTVSPAKRRQKTEETGHPSAITTTTTTGGGDANTSNNNNNRNRAANKETTASVESVVSATVRRLIAGMNREAIAQLRWKEVKTAVLSAVLRHRQTPIPNNNNNSSAVDITAEEESVILDLAKQELKCGFERAD